MSKYIEFNFPETTFSRTKSSGQQLNHIISEMDEVCNAGTNEEIDQELVDLYHSLETFFRIMTRDKGEEHVDALFSKVEEKNRQRGYYISEE